MIVKKTILLLIVAIEIIAGGSLVFIQLNKINSKKVLGITKVAVMDRKTIEEVDDYNFQYYWELKENEVIEESADWLENKVTYTINADGLNEGRNYETAKSSKIFRIVALGDSFTYGHYVNTWENWPEQLEYMLNHQNICDSVTYEVINLGVRGFDIPYTVNRYQKKGKKYNPDAVIWLESSSGFSRYMEKMTPIIRECEQSSSQAQQLSKEEQKSLSYECWGIATREVLDKMTYRGFGDEMTEYLATLVESIGDAELYYLAFSPIELEDQKELFSRWQKKFATSYFRSIIPILKADELLVDGHPSPLGHKRIAGDIYHVLRESNETIASCQE